MWICLNMRYTMVYRYTLLSNGLYDYGSIPIDTFFRAMHTHLQAILMSTRGIGFWPIPIYIMFFPNWIGICGTPYVPCLERLMCWAMGGTRGLKGGLFSHHNFAGAPAGPTGKICPKDSGTVGKGWRCRWGGEMVDLHGFIYMRNIIMKQRISGYLKFSRDTLRQD